MVTPYLNHLRRLSDPLRRISVRPATENAEPAHEAVVLPPPAAQHPFQQEISTVKPQTSLPVLSQPNLSQPSLSHAQRSAERAAWRHACDWLELHHLCANARCRRAGRCHGEPMACFRAAVPLVPEAARQFVRRMIEGQELGLDFEEAFEGAADFHDGWFAWIAGLQAAADRRHSLPVRPRESGDPGAKDSMAETLGPGFRGGERAAPHPPERPKPRPNWP